MSELGEFPAVERRAGLAEVLGAINGLRDEMNTRLANQDSVLAEVKTLATENKVKVENMEKVLPMKFFKALEGTAAMGSIVGKFAGNVGKVGAAFVIAWAVFKFIVLEAIRQTPK